MSEQGISVAETDEKKLEVLWNCHQSTRDTIVIATKQLEGMLKTLVEIALPPGQQLASLKAQIADRVWQQSGMMQARLNENYCRSLELCGLSEGAVCGLPIISQQAD